MNEPIFNLDDCVCFLVSKSAKQLSEALDKRFSSYDVTRVQWISMYYIHRQENITQTELASQMGLKEPTIARLIDRCEKDNLVKRTASKKDKRKKILTLTDKGRVLNETLTQIADQFMQDAIRGIPIQELGIFKKVTESMVNNFSQG